METLINEIEKLENEEEIDKFCGYLKKCTWLSQNEKYHLLKNFFTDRGLNETQKKRCNILPSGLTSPPWVNCDWRADFTRTNGEVIKTIGMRKEDILWFLLSTLPVEEIIEFLKTKRDH